MPNYSGCIEKNQVYFYLDPFGKFKNIDSVCGGSVDTKGLPTCPTTVKEKFPCFPFYKNCMQKGDKICEHPALYCDMFCTNQCREVDEEKSAECYTKCKLACQDEKECPYYMFRHCNNLATVKEGFDYPTTTSSPKEVQDPYFPEPVPVTPVPGHYRFPPPPPPTNTPPSFLTTQSPTNFSKSQMVLDQRFFRDGTEEKQKRWTLVWIIFLFLTVLGILLGVLVYFYFFTSKQELPEIPYFRPKTQPSQRMVRTTTRQRIPGKPISTSLPVPVFRSNPFARK